MAKFQCSEAKKVCESDVKDLEGKSFVIIQKKRFQQSLVIKIDLSPLSTFRP